MIDKLDEKAIQKLYVDSKDAEIKLLCSYTTRRDGFLDILLSGCLMSSDESKNLLGKIKTHRGSSMSSGRDDFFYGSNKDISFSTGFVSFKYSDSSILSRENYVGGLGILISLDDILEYPLLSFCHSSDKGAIKNYDLNRYNIKHAVNIARKNKELYDDGYGNVFEVSLDPILDKKKDSSFSRVISYPRLELDNRVIVAIPENERDIIQIDVLNKQEEYKRLFDKIYSKDFEKIRWDVFEGRELLYVEEMIPYIEKLLLPFDINNLPILWYTERNLDVVLQKHSILKLC